ncbi:unnamed protein product [Nyctereutes procyonoides]|uniref:(raccoon dog) hypothetical protein n=1 Tax=Nyctereutes procyonoides TaxID=34880 RepID=A0A811ZA98_NYCPR|nr:unnamed protein product [Nyctereutes procyonoides]
MDPVTYLEIAISPCGLDYSPIWPWHQHYPSDSRRRHIHPYSSGISRIADRVNGIFFLISYSSCSMRQPDKIFCPIEVHIAEDVPIVAEVHAISEDYGMETIPLRVSKTKLMRKPPAKVCKILDMSQQHMMLKPKCTDSNMCQICKESFSTNMLLIEHTKLHEEDPYICKYCNYKTVIFENLSWHTVDTQFSDLYWCEQCNVQLFSSSEFNLHFQEYSCDDSTSVICGFHSRLHTNVTRYAAIEHTKFFPYVCDDSVKGFSRQTEDLKMYLDFKHSVDLPHKYSDCLMRFGNERELLSQFQSMTQLFSLTFIMLTNLIFWRC